MAHNLTLKLRILLVLTAVVMFWAFLHDIAVSAQEDNTNNFDEFEEKVSVSDPLEGFNRVTGTLNDRLYFWVLKPVAVVYGTVLPPGVRRCIANAFDNLRTPVRFFNNIFQGKPDNALVEL
jgi:phospholipid-binding lipoprotein MlaA